MPLSISRDQVFQVNQKKKKKETGLKDFRTRHSLGQGYWPIHGHAIISSNISSSN